VLALYFLPNFQPGVARSFSVIFSAFVLVHFGSLGSVLIIAWTLFHEIFFYAVFSLCVLHRRFGFSVMAVWLLGALLPLFHWVNSPAWVWFFSPLHLLFGMGMLIASIVKRKTKLPWRPLILAGVIGLSIGFFLYYQVHQRTDAISLTVGISIAFLVLGMIELERSKRLKVWQPLNFLGNASYSIYLIHFPVISFTMRLLFSLSRGAHAPLWLFAVLATAAATLAGIVLHLFVEVPLLRILPQFNSRRLTFMAEAPLAEPPLSTLIAH
jgi:exopolysaccharide production protein ExoZ